MKRGEFLALKREEKKLSVADLARELRVSEWTVERWEAGELPDSEHLLALSSALGVPVEDILSEEISYEAGYSEDENAADEPVAQPEPAYQTDGGENGETEEVAPVTVTSPAGRNGYSAGERKFGYFVFAVFIIAVLVTSFMQLAGWVNRPRELTTDNYKEYVSVDITATTYANPDEYVVRVTAKEDIEDLHITVEAYFSGFIESDQTRTVYLSGSLKKGESFEQTIRLTGYAMSVGYEVTYINGGLA